MEIASTSVDLSKLQLASSRSRATARPAANATNPDTATKVNPILQRFNEGLSKKLENVSKVQQAFLFALRSSQDIESQGILEPIV